MFTWELNPRLITLAFCFVWVVQTPLHSAAKQKTDPAWTSCFDMKANAVRFNPIAKKSKDNKGCKQGTAYRVTPFHVPITNQSGNNPYGPQLEGTKKTILLDNGRRLLASQWVAGQMSYIYVLEPNLKKNTVIKHCVIPNQGQAFNTRYDKQTKQLMVHVVTYKDASTGEKREGWKACKIR
jgi:hypothetical protein